MKRLVIIYLLSVLSFGMYAQYAESSYSVISHRQYGAQDSYNQTTQSHYDGMYQTSSRSAHYGAEQSNGYRSSYHNAVNYQDRVSANTFSSTPSMDNDPLISSSNEGYQGMGGTRMHSPVRPPQRGEGDGDSKPGTGDNQEGENWKDPNATPLGDTPWLLMLLLAMGYALRVGKKIGLWIPDAGK